MTVKNKKVLGWVLLIVWMITIFIFSNQPGDESSKNSEFVMYIFNLLGLDLNSYFGSLATFIVRKGAHFTEYFILFMLSFNVLRFYIKGYKAIIYSILICFLYACSDEFHQLFIPGRAGMFRDVLIDTSGAILGALIMFFAAFKKSSAK